MAVFFSLSPLLFAGSLFAQAVFGPSLQEALLGAGPADQLEVIVSFDQQGPLSAGQVASLQSLGLDGRYLQALPIAGVVATPAQIDALAALPGVRSLWHNDPVVYENDSATALTGVDAARADTLYECLNGGLPLSGHGIGVMINDSGVDGTHADLLYPDHLVQNVAGQASLHNEVGVLPSLPIEDVPHTDVGGGHGTHVAGIVGGSGARSGGRYEGVAPGADLIGYGAGLTAAMLDVIGAFDYALANRERYNIRVITNSWGDTSDAGTEFNPEHPVNIATKDLADVGILVLFSAGNSGPSEDRISGNYKKAPWVITVAAGTKTGTLASFSSRGHPTRSGTVVVDGQTFTWEDRPTVTAPGEHIISARATGGSLHGAVLDPIGEMQIPPEYLPYYTSFNGTSMAAPHVAGIAALMLEANEALDVYALKQIIEDTATEMAGNAPHEVGAGYVDAYAAAAVAFGLDASNPHAASCSGTNGGGDTGGEGNPGDDDGDDDDEGDDDDDGDDDVQARQAQAGFEAQDFGAELPDAVTLDQNYPNPFNPSTQIQFTLPEAGSVRLVVYDLLGRRVRVLVDASGLAAGVHEVSFDAGDLASGTYLYRLETATQTITRRMVLMK